MATVPNAVSVPTTLATTIRTLAGADVSRASDKSTVGQWDAVIKYVGNPFSVERFDAAKAIYMAEFVAKWGCAQVSAADVKAGKGSQRDADTFDYVKRTGRAAWGMGTNRAMARAGVERPKQNSGRKAATTTTTAVETTAMLPPSFLHDMQEVSGELQKFQVHFGSKLSKPAKDAIGNISALHAKCLAAMVPHAPNAAGADVPKGATVQ